MGLRRKGANLENVLTSVIELLVLLVYWNYLDFSRYDVLANSHVFEIDTKMSPKTRFFDRQFQSSQYKPNRWRRGLLNAPALISTSCRQADAAKFVQYGLLG
jgi:hypothetical protein